MSNHAFAGAKAYVDNIGINALTGEEAILFEKYVYGFVTDDYGEMEIADGETADNPLANVKRAVEIANEINANRDMITLRQWYDLHAGDEDYSYYMKEDF